MYVDLDLPSFIFFPSTVPCRPMIFFMMSLPCVLWHVLDMDNFSGPERVS